MPLLSFKSLLSNCDPGVLIVLSNVDEDTFASYHDSHFSAVSGEYS